MGDPVFVGTAGWSIASRYKNAFAGIGSHLERYAARLNAVEINSSFYRPHRRETYVRWAAAVPERFRFSVKLPKAITHERRLADCEALLDAFFDQVAGLGARLGVVLVQLPPSLRFDHAAAEAFLRNIRSRTDAGIALEPRHASWFARDVETLMAEFRIARVAADPPPVPAAAEPGGWPGLVYRRLHGGPRIYYSDYEPKRLEAIALALQHDRAKAETWCIFDNTAEGHAPGNALFVATALDGRA